MNYIERLPVILSSSMAILVGLIEYERKSTLAEASMKMTISIIVFFILGLYVKKTIVTIYNELTEKKRELEEKQRLEQREAEKLLKEEENVDLADLHTIDYRIEDDTFEPLKVSTVIKTKLHE